MKNTVYAHIASKLQAIENCQKSGNTEWENKHADSIQEIVKNYLPSGSGIDNGVKFSFENSTPQHLVFTFGYHAMNENGYYDGWYDYTLHVKPSLWHGIDLRITGKDYNGVKDYLYETFDAALREEIEA